jgi:para-nitrobenzyl esterase
MDTIVRIESGKLDGVVEGGVTAYRGIPYAASPVGKLRFASPAPQPAWSGVRDAGRSGPAAPQGPSRLEAVMGARTPDWNEDGCLTLNVWSPRHDIAGLPVLVWFHGGGFSSGSGGWDWYDGGNLAATGEIVVVTANYRLGPLGYLYLPELGVDNLGTQDQAAVLDWVGRNIAAFGGDPDNVTVGGQSAGALSSMYLAADQVTGPGVAGVISQSGPFGLAPQDAEVATDHVRRYLGLLGIAGGADVLGALRAVPVEGLLGAYRQLAGEVAVLGSMAPPMYPVLGGAGMAVSWQDALADGRLTGKRLLAGTTRDETNAFFAFDPRIRDISAEAARAIAPERFDRMAARLPHATPGEVLAAAETELVFRDGTLAIADQQSEATYVYQFDRVPADDPARLGAAHCAELPFFFDTLDAYPDSPMLGEVTADDRALASAFSGAVGSFVAGRQLDGWAPYRAGNVATVKHLGS